MKEATGELNVTVIVVIIIALFLAFFFSFLWPSIREGFRLEVKCDEAICVCPKDIHDNCVVPADGMVDCYIKEDPNKTIKCAWKG